MELFFSVVAFGAIVLLAAVSPGPDFLVVAKNSLAHSRRVGMYTGIGVGLGILVHVSYIVVGLGLVISRSILLFSTIKVLGALYLIFLGVQILLKKEVVPDVSTVVESSSPKSRTQALKEGFLTNALNPKATVFFVSVFTQFVSPTISPTIQVLYGIEAATIVAVWFVGLALILTLAPTKHIVARFQSRVLKIMGAALILLGVQVALSKH